MKKRLRHILRPLLVLCLLTPALGGCKDDAVMLGIVGYNYTDRYIDRFSVGAMGGGNVFLSNDDGGGGSVSCCIGYDPDRPLPIALPVEWMFGYQLGPDGEIAVPDEHHRTTAVLDGPVPAGPAYLEVHFMPDDTVQLRISATRSPPMLSIDRSNASPGAMGL